MCVIIVASEGIEVPFDIIEKATTKNPHGWGMTIKHPERGLLVRRGMSQKSALRAWKRAGSEYERVFHARISTGGLQDIQNTHPFEITNPRDGEDRRMLFHNGTVSMPDIVKTMCDTWHMAQLLKQFSWDDIQKSLAGYATTEMSRFCIVSSDMSKPTWMFGHWVTRDKVHYSNSYLFPVYEPAKTKVVVPDKSAYEAEWESRFNDEGWGDYDTPFGSWRNGIWIPKDDLPKLPNEDRKPFWSSKRGRGRGQRDRLHSEKAIETEFNKKTYKSYDEWLADERKWRTIRED